jgi:hypothetical protein
VECSRRRLYEPHNLGHWPADEMDDRQVRRQLSRIGEALRKAGPLLPERLSPQVVLRALERHGEGAWAEARWIEDYREFLQASASSKLPR